MFLASAIFGYLKFCFQFNSDIAFWLFLEKTEEVNFKYQLYTNALSIGSVLSTVHCSVLKLYFGQQKKKILKYQPGKCTAYC